MATYQLAQLNIGRITAPLDSPQLAGFVERLDEINALAEAAPGFVWRFQTEDGDATAVRPYDDDRVLINFSVWEGPESLHGFVYRSAHADVMRQRKEWFERMEEMYMVLWWVPEGHRPTVSEAIARLAALRADGPTAFAFTYRSLFPAPGATQPESLPDLADGCPAT